MKKLEEGKVAIYTGNGKGKTTAAIGQAIRAYGYGLKVYIVQFLKSRDTSELNVLNSLGENLKVFRFERERDFFWNLNEEEKKELKEDVDKAYNFIKKVLINEECDVLIIDEIMGVLGNKLLTENEVLELIKIKPSNMELIMTGRNVPRSIIEKADLVTEMKEVKHYFKDGTPARRGIEY